MGRMIDIKVRWCGVVLLARTAICDRVDWCLGNNWGVLK